MKHRMLNSIQAPRGRIRLKVVVFVGAFCLLCLTAAQSQTSLLGKTVSLEAQNSNVGDFLKTLGDAAGLTFTYGNEIPVSRAVRLESKEQSVKDFLDDIFQDDSLKYIEKPKKIIIVPIVVSKNKKVQKQTIKGRVVDLDTRTPLAGANVIINSTTPLIGATTDELGYFKIENLPVGWYSLNISFIGFKSVTFNDIILLSGKEQVVNVKMEELVTDLKGVEVHSMIAQSSPVNDLAMVSSRRISSLEIEYYPGSLNDISRAAIRYSGVLSNNDGQNQLIIRGNSPKGLQWRLEGIEIPNLNHFAEIGSSGGGIGIINNNIIGESDFMMSAFPSEYGNALSGVFDLKMRSGNYEKHEQTFQISMLGIELMVEGPISKKNNYTYIAQYRYSTLKLMEELGVNQTSIPAFQDVSFKFQFPTKKAGTFSVFGIGGTSQELKEGHYDWGSNMAVTGVSHVYPVNKKTWIRSVVALTGWFYQWDEIDNIGSAEIPIDSKEHSEVTEYSLRGSISINRKFGQKHTIKLGIDADDTHFNSFMGWHSDTLYNRYSNPNHPHHSKSITYERVYSDAEGWGQTFQAFGNWKYRINEHLKINTGLHYMKFFLNNSWSLEPRFGASWQFLGNHTLSAGVGLHSRKESYTLYTGQLTLHDGEVIQPNINLDLTKAMHAVLGYSYFVRKDLELKTEIYYQYLYDIPVYPFPPYFSTINFDYGFEGNILVNEGTAYNAGIELTIEKFFTNGYHFLANGTIYDSKYKNYLGKEYDTKYNGSYALKGLFVKEFRLGSQKQNLLSIGTSCIIMGGMRYLPINLEASLANNREIRIWNNGYSEKADDYFRLDFKITFKRNRPKYTGEWSLDIINLTNHKNMRYIDYNNNIRGVETEYQTPLIPLLSYRVKF